LAAEYIQMHSVLFLAKSRLKLANGQVS
jgi:hypothetical protein